MSAIPVVPGSVAPMRPRTGRPLRAVPDAPLAEVHDIRSAPSARRRSRALVAEDPSAARRPARPRLAAVGDTRTGVRASTGVARVLLVAVLSVAGVGVGVGACEGVGSGVGVGASDEGCTLGAGAWVGAAFLLT